MIETLLKILVFSKISETPFSGNIFSVTILIADISLLIFSIAFGFSKVSSHELRQILNDKVKSLLLFAIILSGLFIIIQSWIDRKWEHKFQEDLTELELILTEKNSHKTGKVAWWKIKNFTILFTCCLLSIVPIFCDKVFGIWEVLLFSILYMKLTMFRYIMNVDKVRVTLRTMREGFEKCDATEENLKTFKICMKKNLDVEGKIMKMMKCHNLAYHAVLSLNQRFGTAILCLIFSAFFCLTYCGYNFFIEIETNRSQNVVIGELIYIAFDHKYNFRIFLEFDLKFPENLCLFLSFLNALIAISTTCQNCINEVSFIVSYVRVLIKPFY